ncbi:DUF4037 domain-containing protein [Caulobacter sp. KR2-114]|uniref:DUF4037 domain-containing protein n=1 Tax=Caulobacter sp. KR2-114 TaxID=3400912 RepID=UPI003C01986F
MTAFIPGLTLARRFYEDWVAPRLRGWPHAAALIGDGSEVLGFDTPMSTDHDWGARVLVFAEPAAARALEPPPVTFLGWPAPGAEVTTLAAWTAANLAMSAEGPQSWRDWLATPEPRLLGATSGAVFHDDDGALTALRTRLAYYPDDVWLYRLACQWGRVAEERAFVGRTGEAGDDIGSRLVTARLARDIMGLGFLIERTYAPYAKWFGSAFARLPCAAALAPGLAKALAADDWRARESGLAEAAMAAAELHLTRGLPGLLSPRVGGYFQRPFQVINADEIAAAIRSQIGDAALRARPLIGGVDQFSDSTAVLAHPGTARALGLAAP